MQNVSVVLADIYFVNDHATVTGPVGSIQISIFLSRNDQVRTEQATKYIKVS